jgi:hypothetical protein
MKQALEALKGNCTNPVADPEQAAAEDKAITALRQAIEEAENQEPDLPPVEIGVDVTEHGTTVVAFYRRPNAVMEMFYSQFHPQPKQPKNPSIRIQNHSHTDHPMQHWDRTCPACVADSEPLANPIANQPETSGSPMPVACKHKRYSNDVTEDIATCYDCGAEGRMRFVANDTAPPRKKWVGLDDEDWMNVPDFQKEGCELDAAIYDWIEARLKEKNT